MCASSPARASVLLSGRLNFRPRNTGQRPTISLILAATTRETAGVLLYKCLEKQTCSRSTYVAGVRSTSTSTSTEKLYTTQHHQPARCSTHTAVHTATSPATEWPMHGTEVFVGTVNFPAAAGAPARQLPAQTLPFCCRDLTDSKLLHFANRAT